MNEVFLEAIPIIQRLEEAGYECVFVGGSVRDYLLDKEVNDVDLATSAPPEVVLKCFDKTIPVGIKHGTVLVRWNNKSYEVTTYRVEGDYTDYRHPDEVKFVSSLKDDLGRRDFAINAMAMTKLGEIIDPFNGLADLNSKVISTVGRASERFQEDPLRMMRAIRFISQLGFQLESNTKRAIFQSGNLLKKIAVERIAIELEKLLKGKYTKRAIEAGIETKIYRHLPLFRDRPNLFFSYYEFFETPLKSIAEFIVFTAIKSDVSIDEFCKSYKLSNAIQNKSKKLLEAFYSYQKDGMSEMTLYSLNPNLFLEFTHLINCVEKKVVWTEEQVENAYQNLPIKSKNELNINGNGLLKIWPERKPGPWIKSLIEEIEKQVLLGKLNNDNEQIKKWVKQWNQREKG